MSKDNKVRMPMSTAGITRYFDESKSKITFKPDHIIIFVVVIIIIEFILHQYGSMLIG